MNELDPKAVEKQRVAVTLAGRTYTWIEPGARKSREYLAGLEPLLRIESLRAKPESERTPADAIHLVGSLNTMLDFFYAHHEGMAADKEYLDERANESDIMEAFESVVSLVMLPFGVRQPGKVADRVKRNRNRIRSKHGKTSMS